MDRDEAAQSSTGSVSVCAENKNESDEMLIDTPSSTTKASEPPHETMYATDWPTDIIPVEIFEIITSFLTRHEVRNLRLVCREFEVKVSAEYFRNVVVPFKSELYSNLARDDHGAIRRTSSALFSNGMRIFESFGRHILRFALSLELDEDILAYPPIKPSQEAVPAFWGIYRWPHSTYHRYTDLEGLEQTADETDAMKEALKCLVKVTNLGLCCDAGLGFLSGPDYIARSATIRHPVFGSQTRRRPATQEIEPQLSSNAIVSERSEAQDLKKPVFENPMSFKRNVLQKMVEEAGFKGKQVNEAIGLILQTEGTSLGTIDFDERRALLNDIESRRPVSYMGLSLSEYETITDASSHPLVPASLTRAQKEMLLELEWAHRAMIQSYVIGLIDNSMEGCFSNLTTLTIAKIPSSHVYIFNRHELWQNLPSITNVTLGIIADWRHISKPAPGCVEDRPVSPLEAVEKAYQLLNNYIGIRENITSLHFEWICGGEFAPGTFQRNHYILPAPFFENPVYMGSPDTAIAGRHLLLKLPFIKHLSLKNCWASPHIFLQFFRSMSLASLEKLELETVSLSGPPTLTHQAPLQQQPGGHVPAQATNLLNLIQITTVTHPPDGQNGPPNQSVQVLLQGPDGATTSLPNGAAIPTDPAAAAQMIQNLAPQLGGHVPVELLTLGGNSQANQETLQQPEWLSWAGIMEHFSPSVKIRDILAEQNTSNASGQDEQLQDDETIHPLYKFIPKTQALYNDETKYSLKSLSFKSCGYVAVDCPYLNTRSILPDGAQGIGGNGNPHHHDYSPLMQRCRDKMLGRIAPHLRSQELFQLVNAFGMDIGWANVYDQKVAAYALADGVDGPGRGRFSGTIDANGVAPGREASYVEPTWQNRAAETQEFPPFV